MDQYLNGLRQKVVLRYCYAIPRSTKQVAPIMASIIARHLKDGSKRYRATVRVIHKDEVVHNETRTFRAKTLAVAWAVQREFELKHSGTGRNAQTTNSADSTVAGLIDRYVDEFKALQNWGRTKEHHLRLLKKLVGHWDAVQLTTEQVIGHVRQRRIDGTGASTVNNDLIWLRTVLKTARSAWSIPVNLQAIDDAAHATRHLKLTAKSRQRDRRPIADEIDRLRTWFKRGDRRREIPMHEFIDFALASARREDEICRLRWEDINRDAMTIVVRNMKNPERTQGNDVVVKLPTEALAIIDRQPRNDERIFPHNTKSVSAAFTRGCRMLGIKDLRFHDLRHEATSRLFEAGYQIHEVAHFTGHRSWATLRRYTNLKAADLQLRS